MPVVANSCGHSRWYLGTTSTLRPRKIVKETYDRKSLKTGGRERAVLMFNQEHPDGVAGAPSVGFPATVQVCAS